jgi:hypothetical protein
LSPKKQLVAATAAAGSWCGLPIPGFLAILAMYVYTLIAGSTHPAYGGPLVERPADKATRTRSGRYVVGRIEPHTSASKWPMSAVPWGTPIRRNAAYHIEVLVQGKWVLLNTLPGWKEKYPTNTPEGATQLYMQEYRKMMSWLQNTKYELKEQSKMPAPWNGEFPKFWNLNDFGQVAVKYYKDLNGNRKLDGKEELLSDFVHTTPYDEMETMLSRKLKPAYPLTLGESHGCIHMIPQVLQTWIAKKILAVGATIEVHLYPEKTLLASFQRTAGRVGTEIHFYPGARKIALYKVVRKQVGHPLHPSAHG